MSHWKPGTQTPDIERIEQESNERSKRLADQMGEIHSRIRKDHEKEIPHVDQINPFCPVHKDNA